MVMMTSKWSIKLSSMGSKQSSIFQYTQPFSKQLPLAIEQVEQVKISQSENTELDTDQSETQPYSHYDTDDELPQIAI